MELGIQMPSQSNELETRGREREREGQEEGVLVYTIN